MANMKTTARWLLASAAALAPLVSQAGLGGIVGGVVAGRAVDYAIDHGKAHLPGLQAAAPVEMPRATNGFAGCAHLFPRAQPLDITKVNLQWRPYALCATNFAVLYSGLAKAPLVAVEKLSAAQLADALGEERTNDFFADPRLPPGDRAELSDFVGSSLDRGHMANAADMPDQRSMHESFVLSNMIAQDPVNNRKGGAWFKIEADTRKFAKRATGNVFVFSGPLFDAQPKTIGAGRVWVPARIFKLVFDEASSRAWAHIVDNTAQAQISPPMDYATFVKATGWALLGAPH
jgi:endonuclease G